MKRPRVIANFALTADGKVSTRNYTPTGFTKPADKRRLLEIRALGDAVLVGARTAAADNMSLTLPAPDLRTQRRARGLAPEPLRVIASLRGAVLRPGMKVFHTPGAPLVIFSGSAMPETKRAALAKRGDLWVFDSATVPLETMLRVLRADYGVRTLVCEGGPTLFRALLEIEAIDELRLTWAGIVFGGAAAPTLTGIPGPFLPKTLRARLVTMEPGEGECYLTYRLSRTGPSSS